MQHQYLKHLWEKFLFHVLLNMFTLYICCRKNLKEKEFGTLIAWASHISGRNLYRLLTFLCWLYGLHFWWLSTHCIWHDLKTKSDTMSVLIYTSLLFFFPWFQERFGASWTFIVSNFLNGYQKGRYVVNLCFWSIIWGYLLAFWLNLGWSSDEFVTHIEPQIGSWIHVIKEPCHMNWLTCLQFLTLNFFHWIASWFFQVVLWSPFC